MNPQYEILKNGERFAYTREPFGECDHELCAQAIEMLQSGKLIVGNGVAQICNMAFGDDEVLDSLEFVEPVDQVSLIMSHPSVLKLRPSVDEWSFRKVKEQQ